MLNLLTKNQAQYAYKRYAYKKKNMYYQNVIPSEFDCHMVRINEILAFSFV